tara:strand:+ start:357 stop:725 length:369 start_codon:yes stop_codon:yes gene_type:complete
MAAPNIVNVSTITGITTGRALTTSLTTALVMNPASSGKAFKINSIVVANVDGSSSADASIEFYDASATAATRIASTVTVPADSTLIVVDKNSSFYLEEGDLIRGGASANSDLECLISYEELS